MPNNDFAPFKKLHTVFKVKNIADPKKVVRIFHFPITPGAERDLLAIKGVGEADIRASLLKGEILNKFLANEIIVTDSDIDLLQFNDEQKTLLQSAGIIKGLEVGSTEITNELDTRINIGGSGGGGGGSFPFLFKQNMSVSGVLNGSNRTFTTPDKFINGDVSGNTFKIKVSHNGRLLVEGPDYLVQESTPAMGFDTIFFISFVPIASSIIKTDYVVDNSSILPDSVVTTRQLITFIDEGPAEGFASGAYKEILPAGNPFPDSATWWTSIAKITKIVEVLYTYDGNNLTTIEEWHSFDEDGNIISTVIDNITYDGGIEISRIRTIS